MRSLRRGLLALGVWFAIAAPAKPAAASPLFELVGSNLGDGGFNARAHGPSAASTYFNPALLPQAEQGLELGVFVLNDAISITLDGRSHAVDVSDAVLGDIRRELYPVPTVWLEQGCQAAMLKCNTDLQRNPRQNQSSSGKTHVYQVLGFVNHLLDDHLTLGLYTLVPIGSLLSGHAFFPDEREQYFSNSLHPELYSDRLTPMSLAFGAGSKLTDWLSLGLNFTLNLSNTADAGTYVGDSGNLNETLLLSTKIKASVGIAPHFAVLLEPIDALDVSVTVHTPQKMEIEAATGIYLANGNSQSTTRKSVLSWLPWTLGLGLSYDFFRSERHVWAVTGTGAYEFWSQYVNRQGEQPLRNYEWSNIFVGALGVRYTYDRKLATFLDGNYRPSPVPRQTGRTNYVDNDRIGFGGGVHYDFPIDDWEVKLRVGGQAQMHLLQERHQAKLDPKAPAFASGFYPQLVIDEWADTATSPSDGMPYAEAQGLQTNNPGWPGFSSKGTLVGGGLSLSLLY